MRYLYAFLLVAASLAVLGRYGGTIGDGGVLVFTLSVAALAWWMVRRR